MIGLPLFARYKPLDPVEKMGRNDTCWCGSGHKWKNCHRDRNLKRRLPNAALHAEWPKQAKLELCFHPEAPENCTKGAIRSHTVQRATALLSIAEGNHVLSGRDSRPGKRTADILEKIGINSASTFLGFCSYHDHSAFKAADTALDISREVAFLLGYRALAYEIYMKMVSLPTLEMYANHLDAGKDFADQVEIQQFLNGQKYTTRVAIEEHSRLKKEWDEILISGDYANVSWSGFCLDGLLPVVASGAFYPEYDFSGKRIQKLNASIGSLSLLTFNVIPFSGKTYAVFAWLGNSTKISNFIKSLEVTAADRIGSLITQFCFDTCDNVFAKPSWWEGLDPKVRGRLASLLSESTPADKNPSGLSVLIDENLSSTNLESLRQEDPHLTS